MQSKFSFCYSSCPCAASFAVGQLLSPKRVQKRLSPAPRVRSVLPLVSLSLFLSLSSLLFRTHADTHTHTTRTHARTHTRGELHTRTGGHPGSLAAALLLLRADEMKERLHACLCLAPASDRCSLSTGSGTQQLKAGTATRSFGEAPRVGASVGA